MELKEFWTKTNRWLRNRRFSNTAGYQPELDSEGLIAPQQPEAGEEAVEEGGLQQEDGQVVVKTSQPVHKPEPLDKLQASFVKLVDQLQAINENLTHQITQQQDLLGQMDKMPELLDSFPTVVESQKQLTQQLIEQLNTAGARERQFTETIEKIPAETNKQTDALININHQLAASADTEVQMAENFNRFNQNLDNLNQTIAGQTDSILQMSKTFATSDRYLKYLISRQNKRFMWIFTTAIGVCLFAILLLAGIIIYLTQ